MKGQYREGKGERRLYCAPVLSFKGVGGGRQLENILPPLLLGHAPPSAMLDWSSISSMLNGDPGFNFTIFHLS